MRETELKIKVLGESVLRKKARPVKSITPGHRDTLARMSRLMYEVSGVGLAAPQVGISESLIVVDTGGGLYKLINPKIIRRGGSQISEEGCLSVPGISIKLRRSKRILLKAQDEFGKPVQIEAEDLLACVFQHELDHLDGKLIIDYASFFQRLKIQRKLKEFKKRALDEKLSKPEAKPQPLQL